jgi:hypothetical protein
MKRLHFLSCPILLALLLAACNSNGEYVNRNGTISYSQWTFSFGTVYEDLPEVDPTTFSSVNEWLGHDNKHVYFKSRLIDGADPATIKVKKYPLVYDKKDYYYKGKALNVANPKNLEVINWNDDDMWAIDGKYAYYDSVRIDSTDIATFKLQCYNCATDRNHVYRYGKILPLADPATYIEDWKGYYSRDKSHIWYLGDLMEDVDIATFVIDKEGARDKNGHFYRGKRVTDEEWIQFSKEEDQ